jgi:hypothetical protein
MKILKMLLLASASFALVCSGLMCLQVRHDSRKVSGGISHAAEQIDQTTLILKTAIEDKNSGLAPILSEIDQTAQLVKASLEDKTNGLTPLLERTRKAILAYEKLGDAGRQIGIDERDAIQQFNDEGVKLIGHLDQAVTHVDQKIDPMAASFLQVAAQSQQTLAESSKAIDAAAGLLSDPQIHNTLSNLATTSNNAALMSTDAQIKFHLLLFPPPQPFWKKALNVVETGGRLTFDYLSLKP